MADTRAYPEVGKLEPGNEEGLEGEIPWDIVEDEPESDALGEIEKAEHDPVREPLNVILRRGRLNGLEGQICGESPADEVGDGSSEGVEYVQEHQEERATEYGVRLGNLCPLLEVEQDGVLCELRATYQHTTNKLEAA